ncbi:MAG: NAD(P)H-hydrate dehydratase, partial [Pyramidobacter sp.]|nr:NAD(P)H-hydrate dehydratase [Pyramidobacter sp.]
MIPWYSTEAVRSLDGQLIGLGFSGLELMERVGRGIADFVRDSLSAKSVLILAGAGNNGGDGFVAARHLAGFGVPVRVVLSHSRSRSSGDAAVNLRHLDANCVRIAESAALTDNELNDLFQGYDLVVDALLGTGALGKPRGETARLIRAVNTARNGKRVLAVDVPSGVESGETVVQASWTCTAAARKTPCATGHGAAVCGEIVLIPLDERAESLLGASEAFELEERDILSILPKRSADDHKGSRGGVLIVAGSERYRGAALLAARGALRAGAGIVVLASTAKVCDALSVALPECIAEPIVKAEELSDVMKRWRPRCSALVVGSGLDRDERARDICRIAAKWDGASLWDGDGLYWLALESLRPAGCCVTPHEGEAARLLRTERLSSDRFAAAQEIAESGGIVLLKGYRSIVAERGKAPLIVPRGNRALSIPGSGDVLSGVCGAFLAVGLSRRDALTLGAWCHGAAGERLGMERGLDGILAHEVADTIPLILK